MATIYVVTHGNTEEGPDPRHTPEGLKRIMELPIPSGVSRVVCGTGRRFLEILDAKLPHMDPSVPVQYYAAVGGSEAFDGPTVILPDGRRINKTAYMSVSINGVELWRWLCLLPDRTLLCSGDPLITGLGFNNALRGQIYELDTVTKHGRKFVG